ncbi:MAG: hypothetical protein ABI277_03415 [Burkholderiaceae bacterium]
MSLVAIDSGPRASETLFPNTALGAEAIRIYLNDHDGPVGLAVDEALIDFALRWGRTTLATTTLVSPGAAALKEMLARYASHAL